MRIFFHIIANINIIFLKPINILINIVIQYNRDYDLIVKSDTKWRTFHEVVHNDTLKASKAT
jgi:hypothetical protein